MFQYGKQNFETLDSRCLLTFANEAASTKTGCHRLSCSIRFSACLHFRCAPPHCCMHQMHLFGAALISTWVHEHLAREALFDFLPVRAADGKQAGQAVVRWCFMVPY